MLFDSCSALFVYVCLYATKNFERLLVKETENVEQKIHVI